MITQNKKEIISSPELFLQNYNQFFQTIIRNPQQTHKTLLKSLSLQTLHYHKAQILSHSEFLTKKLSKFNDIYVSVSKQFQNGLAYEYDLVMGYFYMRISMINFDRNADESSQEMQTLGSGGFGFVRLCNVDGKDVAVKRIRFRQKIDKNKQHNSFLDIEQCTVKYQQIRKSIREYAIYKICSMLEIGPRIIFNKSFDIHCYNDCIEFYMQLCDVPVNSFNFFAENGLEYERLEDDLKVALWKMHKLKLVHRDIKPENVLYSVQSRRFILTDFGLTHTVQAQFWQQTLTGYSGTLKYSSPQMIQVYQSKKPSFVNLYFNDIYALTRVLIEFKQSSKPTIRQEDNNSNSSNSNNQILSNEHSQQQYNPKQISRNSMSFAQSYSQHYSYRMASEQYVQQQQRSSEQVRESGNGLAIRTGNSNSSAARTGSSLPILSTNDTNSLMNTVRKSSSVNFYFAYVMYYLLKKHAIQNPLKKLNIQHLIQSIEQCIDVDIVVDKSIKEEVKYRLSWQLFPSQMMQQRNVDNGQNLQLYKLKKQLVFRLRGYGPQSPQTIELLQVIQQRNTKRNKNMQISTFYLQAKQQIQQTMKISIDSAQLEIDTFLHKTINPMKRLKQSLSSINFKLRKNKLKTDDKLFSTIALQYMKAIVDGANVLLEQDVKVINSEMNVFLQSYYIAGYQSLSNKMMLKNPHPYIILNSLSQQQQFVESQIDQYQRQYQHQYFEENNRTYQIIKSIISIITVGFNNSNDNNTTDQQAKSQLFLIIKYIFYLSLKQFKRQQKEKNQIFLFIVEYAQEIVNGEIDIVTNVEIDQNNNVGKIVDQLLKDIYFLAKVKIQAKKDYSGALQILQSLDKLSERLKITSEKIYTIYCQGLKFYSDFFIDLRATIYLRLGRYNQAQQLTQTYITSLFSQSVTLPFTLNYNNTLIYQLKKLFPSTMIQKIHILKKLADIKLTLWKQRSNKDKNNLQSMRLLQQAKSIYQQCIKGIRLLYDWTEHVTLMTQTINNLVVTWDQLHDWGNAIRWCVYCYQLLNKQNRGMKENHLFHVTKNFISLMLKYQLIQQKSHYISYDSQPHVHYQISNNQDQLTQRQSRRRYNILLPQIIAVYIKSRITAMLTHHIFKNLKQQSLSSIKQQNIKVRSDNLNNIEIHFFNFMSESENSNQQLLLLKQMFLIGYEQNMPYMQWNHRQLSLQLSKQYYYHRKQYNIKKSLKHLWNYLANLFTNPSHCDSKDFQHMTNFIEMLIKQHLEKRAFILIRKFIYYLPTNNFILRKKLYSLWINTYGAIHINAFKKSRLEMRWVKNIAKNDYKLFKTRRFDDQLLFQQLDYYHNGVNTIFQSTLYKKWLKKL